MIIPGKFSLLGCCLLQTSGIDDLNVSKIHFRRSIFGTLTTNKQPDVKSTLNLRNQILKFWLSCFGVLQKHLLIFPPQAFPFPCPDSCQAKAKQFFYPFSKLSAQFPKLYSQFSTFQLDVPTMMIKKYKQQANKLHVYYRTNIKSQDIFIKCLNHL